EGTVSELDGANKDSLLGDFSPGTRLGMPTLMTGMFVKVHIHTDPRIELLRIPQEAVQPEEKVWIVDSNVLVQKPVTVAYSRDDYAVVLKEAGGVNVGDSIIVSPIAQPSVGMRVVPLNSPGSVPIGEDSSVEPSAGRRGQSRSGS
ncbi:hypothetical protein N8510_02595, partial [bacterium]|nr:hypothetical protein [bacterium]